jgi:beta-alanine degradation protein BauB
MVICLLALPAASAFHQSFPRKTQWTGAAMRAKAVSTELENNDRVVMTEWRFAPGAETGTHRHAMDYVIVYRTAAQHLVQTAAGETLVEIAEGHSYFRRAGVEHNVINVGPNEVVLVETELK